MKKIKIEIPEGKRAEWVNNVLTLVDEEPKVEYKYNVGDKVKCADNPELIYTVIAQFKESGKPMYNIKGSWGIKSCAEDWLTLIPQDITEPKPAGFKFRAGDKVFLKAANQICTVEKVIDYLSAPAYEVSGRDGILMETAFEPVFRDITERIKTFDDAYEWCFYNNYYDLCQQYTSCNDFLDSDDNCSDLRAYLQLRIITAALNEGWEPTFEEDETRRYPFMYTYSDDETRRYPFTYTYSDDISVDYEMKVISFPRRLCFKSPKIARYAASQFRGLYEGFCGWKKGSEQ